MNITGIIAEYNPFHNGHGYHLDQARERTGADYVVVAMSGDFVQRGGPAVFDKYTRTRMALACGADLVLELPSPFATSSAEDFAACGVALLSGLGTVTSLCFGSECGNAKALMDAARLLLEEPEEYSGALKRELKKGTAFPAARQKALEETLTDRGSSLPEGLLSSPNNILGLEYGKAILRQKSPLIPVTIPRKGAGYHDHLQSDPADAGEFASATGIREALRETKKGTGRGTSPLLAFLPEEIHPLFLKARPLWPEDFSALLNGAILAELKASGKEGFLQYADFSEGLARRLSRTALTLGDFEERIRQLKTRQYTYTRVSRALTHLLLGIKKEQAAAFKAAGYAPYARVLGFRRSAAPLFSQLKGSSRIPLISRPAVAIKDLEGPARALLEQDLYSSHLYQAAFQQKYGGPAPSEFHRKLLVWET